MPALTFSDLFLRAELLENVSEAPVTSPVIVLNVGKDPVRIGQEILRPRESSIFSQTTITSGDAVVQLASESGFSALTEFPHRKECMERWQHVHEIFPLPHLKDTQLWRSPNQQIGKLAMNFWFAAAGTDCGIHNQHDFLEIHTQIWGTGHMQKFHEKNPATMYQDILFISAPQPRPGRP